MADVFISYAREDQSFVRRLREGLVARGKETWVDCGGSSRRIGGTRRWSELFPGQACHATCPGPATAAA